LFLSNSTVKCIDAVVSEQYGSAIQDQPPHPINLDGGDWEVTLTELSVPSIFDNVVSGVANDGILFLMEMVKWSYLTGAISNHISAAR